MIGAVDREIWNDVGLGARAHKELRKVNRLHIRSRARPSVCRPALPPTIIARFSCIARRKHAASPLPTALFPSPLFLVALQRFVCGGGNALALRSRRANRRTTLVSIGCLLALLSLSQFNAAVADDPGELRALPRPHRPLLLPSPLHVDPLAALHRPMYKLCCSILSFC